MEIDLVFKIAAIGIIVAVLNQLLIRSGREDQAMMTTLAGLVVVLSILVKQISVLFVTITSLFALCVPPFPSLGRQSFLRQHSFCCARILRLMHFCFRSVPQYLYC